MVDLGHGGSSRLVCRFRWAATWSARTWARWFTDRPALEGEHSVCPRHRQEALDYALEYARDLDPALADRFVGMYVNEWTVDYGPRGREAVRTLFARAVEAGLVPHPIEVQFAD